MRTKNYELAHKHKRAKSTKKKVIIKKYNMESRSESLMLMMIYLPHLNDFKINEKYEGIYLNCHINNFLL
jgi:hypothetical protein